MDDIITTELHGSAFPWAEERHFSLLASSSLYLAVWQTFLQTLQACGATDWGADPIDNVLACRIVSIKTSPILSSSTYKSDIFLMNVTPLPLLHPSSPVFLSVAELLTEPRSLEFLSRGAEKHKRSSNVPVPSHTDAESDIHRAILSPATSFLTYIVLLHSCSPRSSVILLWDVFSVERGEQDCWMLHKRFQLGALTIISN